MDDYKEFIVKLQTNFGPPDPVGDAEHQLDHLSMKDHHSVNRYLVEFNHYASQVKGYGEGMLCHMFYNGLPDHIKDEISHVGKPHTLFELHTLVQTIDAHYWEHKTECAHQEKTTHNSSDKSKQSSANSTSTSSNSSAKGKDKDKSSQKSSTKGSSSSTSPPDLSNVLGKDGKLTPTEQSRHISNSLCLFCGNAGHNAKDCPKSASHAARACAAQVTTPMTSSEQSTEAKK